MLVSIIMMCNIYGLYFRGFFKTIFKYKIKISRTNPSPKEKNLSNILPKTKDRGDNFDSLYVCTEVSILRLVLKSREGAERGLGRDGETGRASYLISIINPLAYYKGQINI